jgi:uncharacterized protein YlaI
MSEFVLEAIDATATLAERLRRPGLFPQLCAECEYRFATAKYLREHIEHEHPQKPDSQGPYR